MEINPYAPTGSEPPDRSDWSSEVIRRKYLNHEASIQSVGLLYLVGGGIMLVAGLGFIGLSVTRRSADVSVMEAAFTAVFFLGIGSVQTYAGLMLRSLNPSGKIFATIFACIGLFGFPIGTLISAYILYLLHSEKGAFVFSKEYKDVIAATPHVRYRTSIVVWILFFLLVGLVAIGVVSALVFGPR